MKLMVAPSLALFLFTALTSQANASWLDGIGTFFRGVGDSVSNTFDREQEGAEEPTPTKEAFVDEAMPAQTSVEPVRRSTSANPNHHLHGDWELFGASDRQTLGTLKADGTFFTINLSEPEMDMRIAYTQAPNGNFTCTVLDKNVIILEGRFQDSDRFDMSVKVKEIGKPEVRAYEVTAQRSN